MKPLRLRPTWTALDKARAIRKIEVLFTRCDMESKWSGVAPDS